jgi:hypothetical protein
MSKAKKRRWWVSWYDTDCRPKDMVEFKKDKWKPNTPDILGYWESGFDMDGHVTVCALLLAIDEAAVKELVKQYWEPCEVRGVDTWRFIDPVDDDYKPSNRFPMPKWGTK